MKNLKLAQESNETCVKVDILIDLDYYYNFIIGNIIRGKPNEPIAFKSTVGWIISGPYSFTNSTSVSNINSHFLFIPPSNCRYVFENESDHKLSTIQDVESVGVNSKELEIYQKFENDLEFTGERYCVKCKLGLKHKLDCNQKLKEQYNNISKGYEKEGIIKKVNEVCKPGTSHCLPHRAVIKGNRNTSKLKIIFDGSLKQKDQPALKNHFVWDLVTFIV